MKRIIKNILIAVLLVCVGVLTWLNWFSNSPKAPEESSSPFSRIISAVIRREDPARTLPAYTAYTESAYSLSSARPSEAVLCTQDETYRYVGRSAMDMLFQRVSVPLAAALDSLREGRILDAQKWRACLLGDCLLLRFSGEMPMYYFAAALGALQIEDLDYTVRDLLLDLSGDTVVLLAKTPEGVVYAYNTGLRSLNRQALTADYEPSRARFACRIPELLGRVADETMIEDGSVQAVQLTAGPALTDFSATASERVVDTMLESLGFNTYTVSSYIESDSIRVFVEEMRTLRLSENGIFVYNDAEQEEIKPMTGGAVSVRAQNIGKSAQIMEKAVAPYLGAAEAYLARQYYDTVQGDYVVVYRLAYEGKKIELPNGYAARFAFRGTELVSAYVNLMSFAEDALSDVLLPSEYAAAAAGSGSSPADLEIRYTVRQGTARAAWVSAESNG